MDTTQTVESGSQSEFGPAVPPMPAATFSSPVGDASAGKSKKWLVILGIVVGVLLLAGVGGYFYFKMRTQAQVTPNPVVQNPAPALPPLNLRVDSPASDALMTANKVTVSGKTSPSATVTVYDSVDESTVTAGGDGSFQTSVALDKGINTLSVSAFDDNDQEKSLNVNVVYDDGSS